jgi:cadmium resistance protein CadD (predicted permease)
MSVQCTELDVLPKWIKTQQQKERNIYVEIIIQIVQIFVMEFIDPQKRENQCNITNVYDKIKKIFLNFIYLLMKHLLL